MPKQHHSRSSGRCRAARLTPCEHGQWILVPVQVTDPEQARIAVKPGLPARQRLVARRKTRRRLRDLEDLAVRRDQAGLSRTARPARAHRTPRPTRPGTRGARSAAARTAAAGRRGPGGGSARRARVRPAAQRLPGNRVRGRGRRPARGVATRSRNARLRAMVGPPSSGGDEVVVDAVAFERARTFALAWMTVTRAPPWARRLGHVDQRGPVLEHLLRPASLRVEEETDLGDVWHSTVHDGPQRLDARGSCRRMSLRDKSSSHGRS